MDRFVFLVAFGVTTVVASEARATCTEFNFADPERTALPVFFPCCQNQVGESFPGSMRWSLVEGASSCEPLRFELRTPDQQQSPPVLMDIVPVRESARIVAWRIPADVPPGSSIELRSTCGNRGELFDAFSVVEGAPTSERPAPVLAALSAEVVSFEVPDDCYDTLPQPDPIPLATVFATFIDAEVNASFAERTPLLFDAWLLPRAAQIDFSSPNMAEATPLSLKDGRLALRTSDAGELTLHVRLVDSATAQPSEIQSIDIETPAAIYPPNSAQASGCMTTSAFAQSGVLLALLALRMRRVSG
jgi:hypothetical protein